MELPLFVKLEASMSSYEETLIRHPQGVEVQHKWQRGKTVPMIVERYSWHGLIRRDWYSF